MSSKVFAISAAICLASASSYADGDHKHAFAADVSAFHHVLSPLWHAPASAQRTSDVCKAAAELNRLAGAIKTADASKLSQSVEQLQKHCANKTADIEPSFVAVHDAFHALIGE